MPVYDVVVRDISYLIYRVEADNEKAAMQEVQENGDSLDYEYGDGGEWDVISARIAQGYPYSFPQGVGQGRPVGVDEVDPERGDEIETALFK